MKVRFTPEQEALVSQIATQTCTDTEHLVKDAALRPVEEDAKFRAAVREGTSRPRIERWAPPRPIEHINLLGRYAFAVPGFGAAGRTAASTKRG